MAEPQRRPLFLARRAYRRRRLMDAARMLPLVALALWLLPVLWSTPEAPGAATRTVYLFAVWFGLICAALLISGRLLRAGERDEAGSDRSGPR